MISWNHHCLALRHIPCEDLAGFEPLLRERFDLEYVDLDEVGALERLEAAAQAELVVALGGPMAVYEAGEYPFIQREIQILRERIAAGRPTLGICLGAQIMAAAAGARVYAGGRQEVGWYPILAAPDAAADPVLGCLFEPSGQDVRAPSVFFHWHGDTFDLPPDSRPIGASERFTRQGFAIGRHAVALQFHVEITEEALERWLAQYERALKPTPDVMGAEALREGLARHGAGLAARARGFLEAWLREMFEKGT